MTTTLQLATACVLALGCSSLASASPTEWDTILIQSSLPKSGTLIEGGNILVPQEAELVLDRSMQIHATGSILILGNIRIADRPTLLSDGSQDAFNLELIADQSMTIKGKIQGGRGSHFAGFPAEESQLQDGGAGSTITMTSPDLLVTGQVIAGEGGEGGTGARGGVGGSIISVGALLSDHGLSATEREELPTKITYISGPGGLGGSGSIQLDLPPGDSGDSGDVIWFYEHPPALDLATAAMPGEEEWLASCGDGGPGATPGIARTSNGTNGRPGLVGTASSPNGQPGASGGDAGDATGAPGGDGGNGSNCCPDPGVIGGTGGLGGAAVGGSGGNGGKGGDAYSVGGVYQGSGGRGGDSGSGGSATGGHGGNGGDGGDGTPPGLRGTPGTSPLGAAGSAGAVGAGGAGSPAGLNGTAGVDGAASHGGVGNTGNNGDICPNPGG